MRFCASLSAKNRMVQAPKSWYNRYKSYGAPGQKACAETLPFRRIVPVKYVTLFHIIPVPQARRRYMILYLYAPRRNHTILYLHAARHFLARTIRFCTFTNSLPPIDFIPKTTDLSDEYHSFSKLKKVRGMPLLGASRQLTNTPSNGWCGIRWNRRKSTRFSARWQQGKRSLYRPYFPRVSLVKGAHHNGVQEARKFAFSRPLDQNVGSESAEKRIAGYVRYPSEEDQAGEQLTLKIL